jgi:hypothetical protein
MANKIMQELVKLEQQIKTEDISQIAIRTKEWGGADVIICKHVDENIKKWVFEQIGIKAGQEEKSLNKTTKKTWEAPTVTSYDLPEQRRRLVITEYSRELSWLFEQLRDIFSGEIDYMSKYDFYGRLAQSAIDYIAKDKENKEMKDLLLTVLRTAKEYPTEKV